MFSQPEQVAAELRHVLPAELAQAMDWRTLRVKPGTWIDSDLRRTHSDLLCSVELRGRTALIYFLIEHKSWPARFTAFQLLVYKVRIWQDHLRRHPNAVELPLIIPVVLHHGAEEWNVPRGMRDLVAIEPGLRGLCARYVPDFEFEIDDFGVEPEDVLMARALPAVLNLALLCLRGVRASRDLTVEIGRWAGAIRAVLEYPGGVDELSAALAYIMQVGDLPAEKLSKLLAEKVGPEAEKAAMTTADQLRREGRAQGRAEGRAEMLLRLLALRFGELPAAVVDRVGSARAELIGIWGERVLSAATLEDVFRS